MYAVTEWGGGGGGGGGYVLVVKFSGGGGGGGGGEGLCPSCKIHQRDYVLVVKFMGGILSTYTKMSRGVLSGGIMSVSHIDTIRMV